MLALGAFIAIILPTIIGLGLVRLICLKIPLPRYFTVSLAYALGMGFLSVWMFILGVLHIPFNLYVIELPLLFAGGLFFMLSKSYVPSKTTSSSLEETKDLYGIVLFAIILLSAIFIFWKVLVFPMTSWDAYATIAFKAKIFFYEHNLSSLPYLPHQGYPLFVPFLESWVGYNLGVWHEQWIHIIFPFAYISFLSIAYFFLTHFTSKRWAMFGCFLLASANFFTFQATISYRDFFIAFYSCSAAMLLLLWNAKRLPEYLLLAGLLAGIGTFVKVEGLIYLLINTVLFLAIVYTHKEDFRKSISNFFSFALPAYGLWVGYKIYNLAYAIGLEEKSRMEFGLEQLARILPTGQAIIADLFFTANWNILWFIFLVGIFETSRSIRRFELKLLLLSVGLHIAALIFLSTFTASFIWIGGSQRETTISRLILHFFPLCVLAIILMYFPRSGQEEEKQAP